MLHSTMREQQSTAEIQPFCVMNGWCSVQAIEFFPTCNRTIPDGRDENVRMTRRLATDVPSKDGTLSPARMSSMRLFPTIVPAGKHSSTTTSVAKGRFPSLRASV
jgi:hypothetical protein